MIRDRVPVGGMNLAPAWARKIPIIGPGLVRGSTVAAENFGEKTAARDAANAVAPAIPSQPLENKFTQMEAGALGRSDRSAQLAALNKRYTDFVKVWGSGSLSASDAQKFLSSLDEEAKPLYEAARQRGVHVPAADQIVAQQAKQLSGTLKSTMNQIVKGHAATSTALSNAIAAKNAVNASEAMPGVARVMARSGIGSAVGSAAGAATNPNHVQGGAEGAAAGAALANSPQILSRLGLLATDPLLLGAARNIPRFVLREPDQPAPQ
jgi:hypothetical protein